MQAEILAFFGPELLSTAPPTSRLSLPARAAVHPLALWWQSFRHDVDGSIERGKEVIPSHASTRLLELYSACQEIKSLINSDRIFSDFRVSSKFYSAAFEALIAAIYVSRGYRLEIMTEGEQEGRKSCDFVVDLIGGKINVEAKSLEDHDTPEDDRIEKMCLDIMDVSIRSQRCSRIMIKLDRSLFNHEYDVVVREIATFYKSGRNDGHFRVSQICGVEITTISQWGERLPMPWLLESYEQGILCHQWQFVTETEQGVEIRNPQIASVTKYIRKDMSSRILKQIKKASGQLPSAGPSVVHIFIPSFAESSFLDIVDASYGMVYDKLQKDYRRINTVALLGQLYNKRYPEVPLSYNHYLVPNSRPKTPLPDDFNLLFGDENLEGQFGPEGSAVGYLQLPSPLETQRGRSLYWRCSKDGRSQFRIWVTDQMKLRGELVCPPRGRLVCESSTARNLDAGYYRMAITWSKKEMVLYLDRERIGTTHL